MGVWAFLAVVSVASAVPHVVPLQRRVMPIEEQHRVLELLQMEAGPGDEEVPNIKLNSNFFGRLDIGQASHQQFDVVFDTGSDALWVYSDSCQSCKRVHKHVYSRSTSNSYRHKDTPFSIKYGTGESHGTTGSDTMALGDLSVAGQTFGQCDEPDEVMQGFPFDGIVGLSRPMYHDPNGLVPLMETIKTERLLDQKNLANTFAFYLGREENEKSHLIFGGAHNMLHEGILHWVPTLSKNIFWELPLDDILIHEKANHTLAPVALSTVQSLERLIPNPYPHKMETTKSFTQTAEPHLVTVDPFDNAPRAEEITSDSVNIGDVSAVYSDSVSDSAFAGNAVDGYPFTTVAEPILLEVEATVATKPVVRKNLMKPKIHTHSLSHVASTHTADHPLAQLPHTDSPTATHSAPARGKWSPLHRQHSRSRLRNLEQHTQATETADPTAAHSSAVQSDSGNGNLLSDMHVSPGVSIQPCRQDTAHPCVVSMDSGHSLISGPPELIRKLKQYTMPPGKCTEEETRHMPDISFVIGGKLFTLNPLDYLIELEGQCVPAFRERPFRNGHDWVLGEHFMRTFYSVFDYDDMRVGLSRVDLIRNNLETILKPTEHSSPHSTDVGTK